MYNIYHKKIPGPAESAPRILHIDLLCNSASSWSKHLAEISELYAFVDAYKPKQIADALNIRPTYIVFGGGSWNKETQDVCNPKIKEYLETHPDVLTFGYWGDAHIESIDSVDSSLMNVVFCAYDEAIERFKNKKTNAEFAPHPVDTTLFYPDQTVKEIYDWCFIGTNYGEKRSKYIAELKGHFGNYIVRGLGYVPSVPFSSYEETSLIFKQSKIIININEDKFCGLSRYLSDRPIMGMCSGKLVLTNNQNSIDSIFRCGKDLDCYNSLEKLIEKVKHYLSNDSLRHEIGRNAFNATNKYSMKIMMFDFCNRASKYKRGIIV